MVLKGSLKIEIGDPQDPVNTQFKTIGLATGQSFHVAPGTIHRFIAAYGEVELVEVSTSELEDVVRLEDDYNR